MDPESPHEFGDVNTELHSVEWKRFLERLEGRDAWRDKPEGAEVARAALRELVSEQTERLETLLAAHLERESAADPDAVGFQDTAEGERLRRYQMACNRTLLRILETLRKRHRDTDKDDGKKRGRKMSGSASGVESTSQADPSRETFAPEIAQGPEPLVQPAESVPTNGLVGRGSPDPAPSPTAGLLIHENATNEATAPPLTGRGSRDPSVTKDLPFLTDHRPLTTDHSQETNEPNSPPQDAPRTVHVLPAVIVALLALLFGAGLSAAFGAPAPGIGPKSSPRSHFVARPQNLAEISTIPRDNRPRPLSSD